MKTILIIFILLISFDTVSADEIFKRHLDQNYNVIGYSKIESGKETHYDTSYRKTGHIEYNSSGGGVKYDNKFNKVEIIEKDGTIYNTQYQKIGHQKEENNRIIIYDQDWNKKEVE